jgi:hypothetical protein
MAVKVIVKPSDISVHRVPHNGMLELTAIINQCLTRRQYMGYNVREAKKLFCKEFNGA